MKHLFLEGPVQTGKSTFLRRCLEPYRNMLGGFSSQRLTDGGSDIPLAYRITAADDFCLQRKPDLSLPHIFQIRTPEGSEKHPEVFADYGVSLLEKSADKPLILLDEIGGSELLVPAFRARLYQVLAGAVPCIGVIKLNEKAIFMSRTAGYPETVAAMNRQLRNDLRERFAGEILDFGSNSLQDIEKTVKEFLCGIFMTDL